MENISPELKHEAEADMAHAKSGNFSSGNGLVGGVSQDAVMRAVQKYGPEVMTEAGKGFWDDQYRAYPWLRPNKAPPGTGSPNGRKNRLGNVSWRRVGLGPWERWDDRVGCFLADAKGPPSKMVYGE